MTRNIYGDIPRPFRARTSLIYMSCEFHPRMGFRNCIAAERRWNPAPPFRAQTQFESRVRALRFACTRLISIAPPAHRANSGGNYIRNRVLACKECNGNETREIHWKKFLRSKCLTHLSGNIIQVSRFALRGET